MGNDTPLSEEFEGNTVTIEVDGESYIVPDFITTLSITPENSAESALAPELFDEYSIKLFSSLLCFPEGITLLNDIQRNLPYFEQNQLVLVNNENNSTGFKLRLLDEHDGIQFYISINADDLTSGAFLHEENGENIPFTFERVMVHESVHAGDPWTWLFTEWNQNNAEFLTAFGEDHNLLTLYQEYLDDPVAFAHSYATQAPYFLAAYDANPEHYLSDHAIAVESKDKVDAWISERRAALNAADPADIDIFEEIFVSSVEQHPDQLFVFYREQWVTSKTDEIMQLLVPVLLERFHGLTIDPELLLGIEDRGVARLPMNIERDAAMILSYSDATMDEIFSAVNAINDAPIDPDISR